MEDSMKPFNPFTSKRERLELELAIERHRERFFQHLDRLDVHWRHATQMAIHFECPTGKDAEEYTATELEEIKRFCLRGQKLLEKLYLLPR